MTFGPGESALSDWMNANAFVAWHCCPEPWSIEEQLIRAVCLPLNLDQNNSGAFHAELTSIRRGARTLAKNMPVLR
jgi:hypothetical protein